MIAKLSPQFSGQLEMCAQDFFHSEIINEEVVGDRFQFFNRPNVVSQSGFHCRSNSQRFVNPAKVVMHEMQGDRMTMVLNLLRKAFVRRVKRRIPILMVRFWRSTKDVLIWSGSGVPLR